MTPSENPLNAKFVIQYDGNAVITVGSTAIWSTKTLDKGGDALKQFVLQDDGNFVAYSVNNNVLFTSNSFVGTQKITITFNKYANLIVTNAVGAKIWESGTTQPIPTTITPPQPCTCTKCSACSRKSLDGGTFFGLQVF